MTAPAPTSPAAAATLAAAEIPVSGFSHMQIRVRDLAESEQWYAAALGLKAFAGSGDAGYIAMGGAGGRFAIVLSPRLPGAGDGSPVDHLAFGVPTVEQLATWGDALTGAGIAHGGLVESGEGTSIHMTSPDGMNVELIASRRR